MGFNLFGNIGNFTPNHIGFIIDGNRRWAKENGFDNTSVGHTYGEQKVRKVMKWCERLSISTITIYVASVNNFMQRDESEIMNLNSLVKKFLRIMAEDDMWEVRIIGSKRADVSPSVEMLYALCEKTQKKEKKHKINLAFGYDGRLEILEAINNLLSEKTGAVDESGISKEEIENRLYIERADKPELIIRTGGEKRLSSFMLWHSVNSYLYFSKLKWPDFNVYEFMMILWNYRLSKLCRTFVGREGIPAGEKV